MSDHAKRLLLGSGDCFHCKNGCDIWYLADDEIKCSKTRKIISMTSTCHRWKAASEDEIWERNYYYKKYKKDREFINMVSETSKMLKRIKSEYREDKESAPR